MTNTVFVNSTNTTTNIETAALSSPVALLLHQFCFCFRLFPIDYLLQTGRCCQGGERSSRLLYHESFFRRSSSSSGTGCFFIVWPKRPCVTKKLRSRFCDNWNILVLPSLALVVTLADIMIIDHRTQIVDREIQLGGTNERVCS